MGRLLELFNVGRGEGEAPATAVYLEASIRGLPLAIGPVIHDRPSDAAGSGLSENWLRLPVPMPVPVLDPHAVRERRRYILGELNDQATYLSRLSPSNTVALAIVRGDDRSERGRIERLT